jgi:single-stranded-DNA-specific exonuclease
MTLRQRKSICDAIYFNGTDYELPKPPWDIAFTVLRNDFRGKVSIQMNIKAIRSAIS